jgi:hypothetical protein
VRPEDFQAAWASAAAVEGWLTREQGRVLWDAATRLSPPATVVEIGSFRGRSTIVLANAVGEGVALVAVDPHAGSDRGPREIAADSARGSADHRAFGANLARAGVADRVRHVRRFSHEALADVEGAVDLLWIDGAHRFRPARADIVRWGARVPAGGRMLVHDAWSSVGVTLALLTSVTFSRRWRYTGRVGSLASYERGDGPRTGNALRQLGELPWFAGNLLKKAAILLRVRSGDWPY